MTDKEKYIEYVGHVLDGIEIQLSSVGRNTPQELKDKIYKGIINHLRNTLKIALAFLEEGQN